MQLVIDIDEIIYKEAVNNRLLFDKYISEVAIAIIDGTPLPKGHRGLIYEPTKEEIEKTIGGQSNFAECIRDCVKTVFDNVPTIIEADGGEEDEADKEG